MIGGSENKWSDWDCCPFGMEVEEYSFNGDDHRYGFNGEEKADEVAQGVYDLGARHYDARIGRMFSPDPREAEYPWQSTYAYYANNPVNIVDVNGEGDNENTYNAPVRRNTNFNGPFKTRWDFASEGDVNTAFSNDNSTPGFIGPAGTTQQMQIFWNPDVTAKNGNKGAYMWQKPTLQNVPQPPLVNQQPNQRNTVIRRNPDGDGINASANTNANTIQNSMQNFQQNTQLAVQQANPNSQVNTNITSVNITANNAGQQNAQNVVSILQQNNPNIQVNLNIDPNYVPPARADGNETVQDFGVQYNVNSQIVTPQAPAQQLVF